MKKVLIVANVAWTIANFRKHLIQDLISAGYRVYCVADIDDFSHDSIKKLESYGAKFTTIKMNRKSMNPFLELLYMIRLYMIFKQLSPDVILSYTIKPNIFGSFISRLLNIPQIVTINGLGSALLANSLFSKLLLHLYTLALKHSHLVFFQNMDDLNSFVDKKILSRDKTNYVPGSGINTDDFNKCERNAYQDEKIVFLLVARLIADKGIHEYIQAAKLIKEIGFYNCEFLLAGHFDEGNPTAIKPVNVEEWVNNGTIRYLGDTENIKDFFTQADVIVLPSYREGLSRLLLEAASCQKPLIVSNVPGCKDLLQNNKNGFICEPKDVNSLVLAIEKMLCLSKQKRDEFGVSSRNIVIENYTFQKVNTIYLNAIQSILEEKKVDFIPFGDSV